MNWTGMFSKTLCRKYITTMQIYIIAKIPNKSHPWTQIHIREHAVSTEVTKATISTFKSM